MNRYKTITLVQAKELSLERIVQDIMLQLKPFGTYSNSSLNSNRKMLPFGLRMKNLVISYMVKLWKMGLAHASPIIDPQIKPSN